MSGNRHKKEGKGQLTTFRCVIAVFVLGLTMISKNQPAITPGCDEFQVNTQTGARAPSLGVDDNGDIVVVWQRQSYDVFGRRFDSNGNPLSERFVVSEGLNADSVKDASVAVEGGGEFVVSFTEGNLYYSSENPVAVLYPPQTDGTATGSISIFGDGPSDVAISTQGNFLVSWQRNIPLSGIEVRRWDRTMQPISSTFQATETDSPPAVAMNRLGEYVVVWTGDDSSGTGIMGLSFDATDTPRGPEFQVNQEALGDQGEPDVAIDDQGRILVTWTSPDGHGTGVFGRRLDLDGIPISDEFRINTEITGNQEMSSVAMDSRGDSAVVWQSNVQDGSGYGVFLQAFRPNGDRDPESPVETLVNQTTDGNQYLPTLDLSDSGVIGVAWQDESESSDRVLARVFVASILASEIFSDGFESGNTSVWIATVN